MDIKEIKEISLSDIELQGVNVRTDLHTTFSKEAIQELADSINEHGLLQPIVLKGVYGNAPYDVIVGQRRFLAHKLSGKENIKAVFTGEIDEVSALMLSLSENLHRAELSYKDTENAITKLYNHYGHDAQKVAKELGFSVRKVLGFINVSELATEKIRKLLHDNEITQIDAKRALAAAQGDPGKADILIEKISEMTKYEKKRVVEFGVKNPESTIEEIIQGAEKSRMEETVILNLPLKIGKALKKASEELAIDSEMITLSALTNWLTSNEYLDE